MYSNNIIIFIPFVILNTNLCLEGELMLVKQTVGIHTTCTYIGTLSENSTTNTYISVFVRVQVRFKINVRTNKLIGLVCQHKYPYTYLCPEFAFIFEGAVGT